MAALGIRTGHGATITFGTSAFTGSIVSIGGFTQSRPVLDATHLGTTNYRAKQPGDLVDAGEFELTVFYDSSNRPPITGAAETVTITMKDTTTGSGAGAKVAGSAFVSQWSHPELVTDQLMQITFTVVWATGPTFTDET